MEAERDLQNGKPDGIMELLTSSVFGWNDDREV